MTGEAARMRDGLLTALNGHVVSGREHSKRSVVRIVQLRDSDDDDSGNGGDDGGEEVEGDDDDDVDVDVNVNVDTNRAQITELTTHLGAR